MRDDGLVAFQLPHQLPLRARLEPRRRLYLLLRRLGFSSRVLYWRLGLHPMRITWIDTSEVCGFLTACGARVLEVEQREAVMGSGESIYFVSPAGAQVGETVQ